MSVMLEDTIAAVSTPSGVGGIAVLRVSGPAALEVVDKVFRGKVVLRDAESHRAYFGRIVADDEASGRPEQERFVDDVVVTVFRKPNSYTGQDVVEISCHGGPYLTRKILNLLLRAGARLAEPGEFTQRAFLNGRMDLSQAEAVADLIRARSELNLRAAQSQYTGVFSRRIQELRSQLIEYSSLLELELDFAEEDVEFANREELRERLGEIVQAVDRLLGTYERGKVLREGAKLVIVGRPNVGKSSLLNALLREDRAIVTEEPGTTRDVLEEQLDIRGLLFRVVDTAGVREAVSRIEKEGVLRTLRQVQEADILLLLLDGSRPFGKADDALVQKVLADRNGDGRLLVAINKIDLPRKLTRTTVTERVGPYPVVEISAKHEQGLEELEAALVEVALNGTPFSGDEALVVNLRQKRGLEEARDSLSRALQTLDAGLSSEFVAVDLRAAMDALGSLIGEVTTEDILGNIFANFCIGK